MILEIFLGYTMTNGELKLRVSGFGGVLRPRQ